MLNSIDSLIKGDYPRTRASDSKHFPAVILNVLFGENTRFKFHHGFL